MPNIFEKRRTNRVPVAFKVKVQSSRGTMHGVGRDLSEGGLGVVLHKLPPVGSPVELTFRLPGNEQDITVTGEVMYQERGQPGTADDWVGIRFLRMDVESQQSIRKFVKARFDPTNPGLAQPPPLPRRSR